MRIKATSAKAAKRVDVRTVAQAFGAHPTDIGTGRDTNPFSLWQLRGELERLLQSTGGRSALPTELPLHPSPAQVAAVMLHMAV